LRRSLRRDVCPTSCCRGGTAVRVTNFRSRWNDRSTGSNASLRRPGRTRLSVDCAPWLNAPTQHRGGIGLRRDGRARLQNSRFRKCSRSPPHSIRMRLSRFPVVASATPSRSRAYSTSSRIVAWCWHLLAAESLVGEGTAHGAECPRCAAAICGRGPRLR
jgi:hypothetical protein